MNPTLPSTIPLWSSEALSFSKITMKYPKGHNKDCKAPCIIIFLGGGYRLRGGSNGWDSIPNMRNVVVGEVTYRVFKAKPGQAGAPEGGYPLEEMANDAPSEFDTKNPLYLKSCADGQRSVRLIRSMASSLGVDPGKIGVMGFSAGGHMAAMLGSDREVAPPSDANPEVDKLSPLPNFMVLAYPFLSCSKEEGAPPLFSYTEMGVRFLCALGPEDGLDGEGREIRRKLSPYLHVTAAHPPLFIWHCKDDNISPYEQSVALANATAAAGIRTQITIYPEGGHAIGLCMPEFDNSPKNYANDWMKMFWVWLEGTIGDF